MANKIIWVMIPVESSNILAIGHDAKTSKLRIQFKSGLYEYNNVSRDFYGKFLAAESQGKFFQQHKAGLVDFIKIT